MKYLEEIELLNFQLEVLQEGKRVAVTTEDLDSITSTLCTLINLLGTDVQKGTIGMTISDIYGALTAIKKMDMEKVEYEMRNSIVTGLQSLKKQIAELAYYYYETHDFIPDENNIPILKEVVSLCKE